MAFPDRLEGSNLILREFVSGDWTAVQEYARDPEVVKYENWGPNTEAETKRFVRFAIRLQKARERRTFEFAIVSKESGKLIGACGIRMKDPVERDGDIGYTLRRDQWGRGFGSEAARLLIEFGFQYLRLHRIWATCHVDNLASARVLEKAGMRREGLLRKNRLQRGGWRDSYLYAVLEDDERGTGNS